MLGVDDEVEDDLLKLGVVALDERKLMIELGLELDVPRAQPVGAQAEGLLDDGVEVDGAVTRPRLAGEDEEVADDASSATCLLLDQADRLRLLLAGEPLLQEELGERGDPGQRIVDLVGDAGDELAEGDELLGLAELLLEAPLLDLEHPHVDGERDG